MIKRVTKYLNYILAFTLLLWVVLGYNIVPFALGSLLIYLAIFVVHLIESRRNPVTTSEGPTEGPYRVLISSRSDREENHSFSSPVADFALEENDVDDEEFEHIEGYDEDEDTYEYLPPQEETKESDVTEPTDFDLQYRKVKIDRVLERVSKIPKMGGIEFEDFLRDLYDALGYVVHKTDINDQGADLIVMYGGEKIVIQAKRYKNKVTNSAIQQVFTAKAFYDCDKAIVITNSEYTKPAREVAEKVGVELWDAASLQSMLSSMKSMT